MLREAGGTMTDYAGTAGSIWNGEVVAGNETIQGQLLKLIKGREIAPAIARRIAVTEATPGQAIVTPEWL